MPFFNLDFSQFKNLLKKKVFNGVSLNTSCILSSNKKVDIHIKIQKKVYKKQHWLTLLGFCKQKLAHAVKTKKNFIVYFT